MKHSNQKLYPLRIRGCARMCTKLPKKNRETSICKTEYSNIDINHSNSVCWQNNESSVHCEYHRNNKEETLAVQEKDHSSSNYLEQRVFRLLLPALEETLNAASKQNILWVQKCRFNGLDYLAEILWNHNSRRLKKFSSRLNAFDIPIFKQWLHLRLPYPRSWLWSKDEAALYLQRYVRGWLVRKRTDVQEMRQFWKDIAARNWSGRQMSCTVQQYEMCILDEIQFNDNYGTMDVDSVCCKKYRWMVYANKTSNAKVKDVL